jgi:hypothetical protein
VVHARGRRDGLAVGKQVAPALLELVAGVRTGSLTRARGVRGRIGVGIRVGIRRLRVLRIVILHEIDVALDLEVHGVVVEVAGFGVELVIFVILVILYELPVAQILGSFAEPGVLGFVVLFILVILLIRILVTENLLVVLRRDRFRRGFRGGFAGDVALAGPGHGCAAGELALAACHVTVFRDLCRRRLPSRDEKATTTRTVRIFAAIANSPYREPR